MLVTVPLTVLETVPFLCPTVTTEICNVSPGWTLLEYGTERRGDGMEYRDLLQFGLLFSHEHM